MLASPVGRVISSSQWTSLIIIRISQTEGVNTKMIDDFSPLGSTPAQLHHLHSAVDGDETDSSSTSDDSTTTDEDTDGEETDTEGEYEDAGALTSTEDEAELVTAREAPTDYFGRGEPLTKVVSPEQFEPADLPPAVPAIIVDPHAPTPTTTSAPTLPLSTTSSTTTTRSTDAPSRPASRRSGLSLPGFMKRRDSSKSVVSVNTPDASDINSTDVDSSTAVGGDGKKQQKKKRFSRRKREVEPDDGIGAALLGAGAPVAAVGAPEMVKKGKGKKARKAAKKGDGEEEEGEEERGERKQRRREKKEKRLERRRTKRDYTFADDEDILGLVQIEIKSATDLPRFKNSECFVRCWRGAALTLARSFSPARSAQDWLRHGRLHRHLLRSESLSNPSNPSFPQSNLERIPLLPRSKIRNVLDNRFQHLRLGQDFFERSCWRCHGPVG